MNITATERLRETEAQRQLASLAAGRHMRRKKFTVEGLTYERLYDHVYALRQKFAKDADRHRPICIGTDDRVCIAAALLASLNAGPPLMIPHSFDADTLEEARQSLVFTHAITDQSSDLPRGITGWPWPGPQAPSDAIPAHGCIGMDATWLYLFTGGSTGTPRIWSKTTHNMLMEAIYLKNTFDITEEDTILATVPSNHIYGLLYTILLPLVTGATVSAMTPTFPNEIVLRIQETEATVLVSIPAHYRALKDHRIRDHQVRVAFSSAGALAEEDSFGFYKATGIAINEIYGSTETGGIAQRNRAKGQTCLTPLECVDVEIKDNDHLWVRSTFLSNELVRSKDGFFETSDRAAWSGPSGFTLLGRSDGIVKVGGKRVDMAKTREMLMQVTGVNDVYVFAVPVQSGRENEIVALVEGDVRLERIQEAVNLGLPSYARPRNIKITHSIPLSSTGKYNLSAIRKFFEPPESK